MASDLNTTGQHADSESGEEGRGRAQENEKTVGDKK